MDKREGGGYNTAIWFKFESQSTSKEFLSELSSLPDVDFYSFFKNTWIIKHTCLYLMEWVSKMGSQKT